MRQPTTLQMLLLCLPAIVLGLGLSEALHASSLASVGLVAGIGILTGLAWAGWSRSHKTD
jgi:hypothetical protein